MLAALLLLPMDSDEPFGIRTAVAPPKLVLDELAALAIGNTGRRASRRALPESSRGLFAGRSPIHNHCRRGAPTGRNRSDRPSESRHQSRDYSRTSGRPARVDFAACGAGRRGSDCNGIAIVKYAALDDVSAAEHRLIIVCIDSTREDHMVVGVRSGARWLILDNRTMALVDSGESPYVPLLEFEQNGVRQFVSPNPNVAGVPCTDAITIAEQNH
jgi:hypothetical protein